MINKFDAPKIERIKVQNESEKIFIGKKNFSDSLGIVKKLKSSSQVENLLLQLKTQALEVDKVTD